MPARMLLLCCTAMFACLTAAAQKNIEASLSVGEQQRDYIIHLPAGYSTAKKYPLVLVFHGGGGNYRQMQRYMKMDEIADREAFIAVYPNGVNKQWNDGREFKESIAANDDVLFIQRLLDSMQKNYAVDTKRLFATGISNGGFFSFYLAAKLSDRLLAVAPVCATIPEKVFPAYYPANPVSLLLINGTADPLVPYNGGSVGSRFTGSRGDCVSTDSTIQRFIQVNKTTTQPVVTELPDKDKRDNCKAIQYLYSNGIAQSRVCLVKIVGGGHTLPGSGQYLPKFLIGKLCNDFEGNEMIWQFFKTAIPK